MANKAVKLPSMYGPVDIQLITCDGPDCTNCNQVAYMVGWFKLGPQGIEVATIGSHPDPLDFCSLECLYKAVSSMTGH